MTTTPADAYNYDTFRPGPYVENGCAGPEQGESLADATVWRANGEAVRLADLTDSVTVVEAGSTTCPLYRGNVSRMRRVAQAHPETRFLMLYTREAHPGGRRGPHNAGRLCCSNGHDSSVRQLATPTSSICKLSSQRAARAPLTSGLR